MNNKIIKAIIKANKSNWNKSTTQKVAKKGLYDVWYIIIDDIPRRESYWIRYSLLVPKGDISSNSDADIDSLNGGAALWFGYFNANKPSENYMIKKRSNITLMVMDIQFHGSGLVHTLLRKIKLHILISDTSKN